MVSKRTSLYVVRYMPLDSTVNPPVPQPLEQLNLIQQLLVRETVDRSVRVVSSSKSRNIRTAIFLACGYFRFNPETDVIVGKKAAGGATQPLHSLAEIVKELLEDPAADVLVLVTGEDGIRQVMKAYCPSFRPPPIPHGSCWRIDTSEHCQHQQLAVPQPTREPSQPQA